MAHFGLFLACLLMLLGPSLGDYYSSLLHVEKLIDIEDRIIRGVEEYISSTEKLLDQCEKAIDIWEENHKRDMVDPKEYVKVPTNGFKLIKRNTVDLDLMVERFLQPSLNDQFNVTEIMELLPTEIDLYETTWAIAKLHFVYNIPFEGMLFMGVLGWGDNFVHHRPLRADELIIFYQQLFSNKYNIQTYFSDKFYVYIEDAMKEVSKDQKEKFNTTLEYFERMVTMLKDYENPYHLYDLVLNVSSLPDAEVKLSEIKERVLERLHEHEFEHTDKTMKYQKLCKGQGERSVQILSKLRCYYKHRSKSFYLLIAPLKVEELNLEPQILLFHNMLTDVQIEIVKNSAKPNMKRSKVVTGNVKPGGEIKSRVSKIRLTNSGSLSNDSTLEHDMRLVTEDATGLEKTEYENFYVNIYGVGGYYVYHMDSSTNEDRKRVATFLYYLSDVQLGGATIFPSFNLTVPPRKGTAIFWYNTHTSGKLDYRMIHSACPVLIGYKWIGTHWIRNIGQTFHRPCVPGEFETTEMDFNLEHTIIPELQQQ